VQTLTAAFKDKNMSLARTPFWNVALIFSLMLAARTALCQDGYVTWPPPLANTSLTPPSTPQPPSPYPVTSPGPGQDMPNANMARQEAAVAFAPERTAVVPILPQPAPVDEVITSTWYFRQDAFYWNERSGGTDFVNERGPLSTLGYVRKNRFERFRMELFGGAVGYDGGAQFEDGSYEAYFQSNGTDYLGVRGEYELLIEPSSWSRARVFLGIGTRFWFRDLQDSVTPSGRTVLGYQENWWTFYPYIGLETKEPDEPGWHLFGSTRFGLTPLTYERINDFGITLHPRCGLTAQAELGVRYQHTAVSAFIECMTWGASGVVQDAYQPDSRMLTVGGKIGYTF
jgi:hypothetical protein